LYDVRTLRRLGQRIQEKFDQRRSKTTKNNSFTHVPFLRRFICGLLQLLCIPFITLLGELKTITAVALLWYMLTSWEFSGHYVLIYAALMTFLFFIIQFIEISVAVLAKWIILGRAVPGVYPLWGVYFFRVWLVDAILKVVHVGNFAESPFMIYYYRLLGSRVGEDSVISAAPGLPIIICRISDLY